MRDDADRPRPQLARERARRTARRAAPASRAPNSCTRDVRRAAPPAPPSRRARRARRRARASARTIGTVAAEHRVARVELLRGEDRASRIRRSRGRRARSASASRAFGSSGASSVSRLPMNRIVRGVGTKPAARYARSSPGFDHRDRDVRVDGARRSGAAATHAAADRVADDRRREAVPDARASRPPSRRRRRCAAYGRGESRVAPVEVRGVAHDVVRVERRLVPRLERRDAAARHSSRRAPRVRSRFGRTQIRSEQTSSQPSLPTRIGPAIGFVKPSAHAAPARAASSSLCSSSVEKTPRPRAAGVVTACTANAASPLAHARARHREHAERRAVVVARLVEDARPGRVARRTTSRTRPATSPRRSSPASARGSRRAARARRSLGTRCRAPR